MVHDDDGDDVTWLWWCMMYDDKDGDHYYDGDDIGDVDVDDDVWW